MHPSVECECVCAVSWLWQLENAKEQLNIKAYGISVTTIEDVFLKVASIQKAKDDLKLSANKTVTVARPDATAVSESALIPHADPDAPCSTVAVNGAGQHSRSFEALQAWLQRCLNTFLSVLVRQISHWQCFLHVATFYGRLPCFVKVFCLFASAVLIATMGLVSQVIRQLLALLKKHFQHVVRDMKSAVLLVRCFQLLRSARFNVL